MALEGLSMFMAMGTTFLVAFLAIYIYSALALMTIAKKTNTPNGWLAWIPIANMYLMTQIAGVPWWTFLVLLVSAYIPMVGALIVLGITLWWWWKIAEARNRPGWWGILMILPLINLIIMGVLAWAD